jgi:hypothetical protein
MTESRADSSLTDAGDAFVGGYPTPEAAASLFDELDYQRAVQAYIWAVPLVNAVAVVKALVNAGVDPAQPSLLVFDHPLTPKQIVMTANAEVVYAFTVVDLAQTGPVVIDTPAELFGAVVDMWMRGTVDIGIGPGRGQRLLLVPPGYDGAVPDGYYLARPRTRRIIAIVRGIVSPGAGTEEFVKLVSEMNVSRLDRGANDETAIILNGTNPFNSDWPKDARYFDYMAEGLADLVIEEADKLMYAMIGPLGLGPVATAPPDERVRGIFARAATTAAGMVATLAFGNRETVQKPWPDRRWEPITFVTSAEFESATSIDLDQRAQGYYQLVGNGRFGFTMTPAPNLTAAVPGTGATAPGVGSWYVQTYKDGAGAYLNGSRTYRLRLRSDPPVKQFWSATVYDNRTRSMIDTDQQRAGLSTYSPLVRNPDGSIDLYFGPNAPDGKANNWIKTIPEQGFFVMFRLYGPLEPALDGTWKLDDIEVVS